jgi:energy-coupling factor transporter ATP-binding protein EcfA2
LGINGSGKTTLAKHLNGLLSPDAGEVLVLGGKPEPEKVGYAFQNPDHQLFETTVEREVAFGPANLKLPPQEVRLRVNRGLEAVGLTDLVTADPHTLSAGQKRLVGIASVLALDPPVLVLDEPSAGLDRKTAQTVMETLRHWNQGERTVIVLTHDTELASRFCTRLAVMDRGKILYHGEPDTERWRDFIL